MKKNIVMMVIVMTGMMIFSRNTGDDLTGEQSELVAGLMETVLVEAGSFEMGSNNGKEDEKPVHMVTLTTNYYMGSYEVTQKQWNEVMGNNPSYFEGENLPVESVSWYEAIEFCNALSEMEGLEAYYSIHDDNFFNAVRIVDENGKGYRLPSEAEWEYAAKGGKDGDHSLEYAGSNSVGNVAWYVENSGNETHEVGAKQANSLGLYDMSGNVWEWCWDWYIDYSSNNITDPTGAIGEQNSVNREGTVFRIVARIVRGGSYYGGATIVRIANRLSADPRYYDGNLGFRVVRFQ